MRKFYLFMVFFFCIGIQQSVMAQAAETEAESDWSYGISTGFSNKYLWRGIQYNKGLVFQPEAYIAWKDLSFYLWSNTTLHDVDGVNAHEIDYTIDFYHSFKHFDVESYLSYYQYIQQEDAPNTAEFFLGGYYPMGNLTFYSNVSVDVLEYAGATWFEFGLTYEQEIAKRLSVTGALLGGVASKKFNENYLGVEKGAFNLVGGNVGLSYNLFSNFYLDGNFYLNMTIDKALEEAMGSSNNAFELKLRFEF
jgi:hypothetical protein